MSTPEQLHEKALDSSQQHPSPICPTLTVVRAEGLPHLKTLFRKKERKYYATAIDGLRVERTSAIRSREQSVQWDEILSGLIVDPSSRLIVHVSARRTWLRDVRLGLLAIPFESIRSSVQEFDIPFDPIRKTALVLSIATPEASQRVTSGTFGSPEALRAPRALRSAAPGSPTEPNTSSDDTNSADPMQIAEKGLSRAGKAIASIGRAQNLPLELVKAVNDAPGQLDKVADLYETWDVALGNVKLIVDVVDKIPEIHPWAQMAWSILSCIPKASIAQVERDSSSRALLAAIRDAFDLTKLAKALENLQPGSTQVQIVKEMLRHGAITTQMTVAALSNVLENVASDITDIGLDVKMANIPFPEGARHSKDKTCIPGTRVAFLEHITSWVNNPESPRTLVLFGQAGTGGSSIANELACRFEETHRLASSFVFSRTERTDQSHRAAQLLFSEIARNLADRYPTFKASLAKIIDKDASLVLGARDYTIPFESMLLRPLQEFPLIGPIFIVIDALDESGDASGRDGLHAFLASHISELPDTFHILITSRPEKDIEDAFDSPDSPLFTEILI
ncbi:hypothetical protein BC834DRAFT_968781 [Gloeopeniophorella convolvens]|nr:hypothetical protein BC834DRAFT_968781 [Gloeopeniophorella convolvens]